MPKTVPTYLFLLLSNFWFLCSTLAQPSCPATTVVEGMLSLLFDEPCNEPVRTTLHLAFHDAMGFSLTGKINGGGADGSIVTFNSTELMLSGNEEMSILISWLTTARAAIEKSHGSLNMSDGDFLYLAAAVGVSSCPGAPRLSFFAGRPQASIAVTGNSGVPIPTDTVSTIIDRFADVGLTVENIIGLLAAHSIASNHLTDKSMSGKVPGIAPLDSTPAVFDTQFYIETLLKGVLFPGNGSNIGEALSPMEGEVRLLSDFAFARDPRTGCLWQSIAGNQTLMQQLFAEAFHKLSIIGQNESELIDCSFILPDPSPLPADSEPHIPAGFSIADIEQNPCSDSSGFPVTNVVLGDKTLVSPATCWGSEFCWGHFPATQCDTGSLQCCDDALLPTDPSISPLLEELGIVDTDNTTVVGVTCSPLSVIGVGGTSCTATPLCCTNNSFNGVVALGCLYVNLNL